MPVKQLLTLPLRIVLTAYCFLQFAAQVLWLGKWQMPRLIRQETSREKDAGKARGKALYAAHRHVKHLLATLNFLGLVTFRFEGTVYRQPCLMVANHPSLLDFIVLLHDLPNAICLYKAQSLENPVLSSFVRVAGYIEGFDGTASASKRIISACCERYAEGHHVVFFPESTRSASATTVRKFRTTAFHAAIKCAAPVQPIVIFCQPLFLGKQQSWLAFSKRRNRMTIRYLPVIHATDLPAGEQTAAGLARAVNVAIVTALAQMSARPAAD